MINSKKKGARGELEFCKFLHQFGFTARRGVQYSGGEDSPDIVTDIPWIHWEIKRVEKLQLSKAMKQAIEDAGKKMPIVAHRKNNEEWLVTLRAEDLITIIDGDY